MPWASSIGRPSGWIVRLGSVRSGVHLLVAHELEPEGGAAVGQVLGPDAAAHALDERAAHEQADPRPRRPPGRAPAALEQAEQLVRGEVEARARRPPPNPDRAAATRSAVTCAPVDPYFAALPSRFRRTTSSWPASPRTGGRPGMSVEVNTAFGQRRASSAMTRRTTCWTSERLPRGDGEAALDAGDDEQVLHEPQQPEALRRHVVHDRLERLRDLVAVPGEEHRAAVDRRDGRPQLVRQDAEERLARLVRRTLTGHVREHRHGRQDAAVIADDGARGGADDDLRPVRPLELRLVAENGLAAERALDRPVLDRERPSVGVGPPDAASPRAARAAGPCPGSA